jgi:hypothetical protein
LNKVGNKPALHIAFTGACIALCQQLYVYAFAPLREIFIHVNPCPTESFRREHDQRMPQAYPCPIVFIRNKLSSFQPFAKKTIHENQSDP